MNRLMYTREQVRYRLAVVERASGSGQCACATMMGPVSRERDKQRRRHI